MDCYNCGARLTEHDFCTRCGADVQHYKKVISVSNFYYNDGLDKAKVRDLSGAVMSLTECIRLNKVNVDARNLLGLVLFEMGEVVDALSEWVISKNLKPEKNIADDYLNEVQKSPSYLDNLNQSIRKYNQSLAYCKQDSLDLAVIQLKKVLSMNPGFLKAHQLLALLYINAQDWEKARRELIKCSRIDVKNTTTLRYMKEVDGALAAVEEGKGHKGRRNEEAVKYQSGNETIIQPLSVKEPKKSYTALLYLLVGGAVGLAAALTLILPARLQNLRLQLNEESRIIGEQLDKKNAEMAEIETQLEALQSRNTSLTSELEIYSGTDGTMKAMENLLNVAYIYLDTPEDTDKIAEALEDVNQETLEAQNVPQGYKNLYEKLLESVGPSISEACYEKGNTAYRAGDYDTAITELEKAFSFDETNSDALFLLGNAYNRKGDSENAIRIYNQGIELFPNTEGARRARESLRGLES